MNRFKAVMLTDELSCYNSFALGALYSDDLACLLVLKDVATGSLDFAVRSCIASYAFHLLAISRVVLQDIFL